MTERPHNFIYNYGRPDFKLPYRWNNDTPLTLPLGPKNINATSPYLIGVIDIRWDSPTTYIEHNGYNVLGVNVYRSYDTPEGPYTKLNDVPVGALYYRDETREIWQDQEDPVAGGRFIAGTNANGDYIAHTYNKPIVIPGTNGLIANHPKHVKVEIRPTSLDSFQTVPAFKVLGETGEIFLINKPVYNHQYNRLDPPVLPILSSGGEIRISYTYINNFIQNDINRKIYYKCTTVAIDGETDEMKETPLNEVDAISLYDMEKIDWIWAESIRRNRWILEQAGERVKVFIRKWAGELCPCWDEQYRTPKNDCHLCFPAGTEIAMGDFTRKYIELLKKGDKVLTHKGRVKKVLKTMNRDINEDLVEITSIHGIRLSPTKNHPILVLKKEDAKCIRQKGCICTGKDSKLVCNKKGWVSSCNHSIDSLFKWIPAEDIEKGDYLLTPIPMESKNVFNNNELTLLGYYAAEGWTSKRNKKKGEKTEEDKRILFGFNRNEIDTCVKELKNSIGNMGHKVCITKASNTDNGITLTTTSLKLVDLALKNVGKYSYAKKLSEKLSHQDIDGSLKFLGAYFNGDGCQVINPKNSFISSSSASYQMTRQIQSMLLKCGIVANFIKRTRILSNPGREGVHRSTCYELKICKNYMNILYDNSFYKKLEYKKSGKCFINNNYLFYPVQDVKNKKHTGKVYNIEVGEDNSYIANGVAVHNCYGTGYVGGYEGPIDYIIAPPETEKTVQLTNMGLHISYDWNSWGPPYPLLNDRDFIVRQNNDRFTLAHINPQGSRGAIYQQHFMLSPLDHRDPRYLIPIGGGLNVPAAWNAFRQQRASDASPTIPNKPEIPDQYELQGRTVSFENIVY